MANCNCEHEEALTVLTEDRCHQIVLKYAHLPREISLCFNAYLYL